FPNVDELKVFTAFNPSREFNSTDLPDSTLWLFHATEFVIVDKLSDNRCIRILSDLKNPRFESKCIKDQEATAQHLSYSGDNLNDFQCLHASNNSGEHAEYTRFSTVGDKSGRWWSWIQITIIGTCFTLRVAIVEHRHLALKPKYRRVHIGLSQHHARIIHQVARSKIIRSIRNDIVARHNVESIRGGKPCFMNFYLNMGIQSQQSFPGGVSLGPAHVVDGIQHLTLQVGIVHPVELHQPNGAYSGRGKVQQRGAAQSACAHNQDAGSLEFLLGFQPETIYCNMAAVPGQLLF